MNGKSTPKEAPTEGHQHFALSSNPLPPRLLTWVPSFPFRDLLPPSFPLSRFSYFVVRVAFNRQRASNKKDSYLVAKELDLGERPFNDPPTREQTTIHTSKSTYSTARSFTAMIATAIIGIICLDLDAQRNAFDTLDS